MDFHADKNLKLDFIKLLDEITQCKQYSPIKLIDVMLDN